MDKSPINKTPVRLEQVALDDAGMRLDRWFKKHVPTLAHVQVEKALRKGQIRVNGKRTKGATRVEAGQTIRVPPVPMSEPAGEKPRLDARDCEALRALVLYQDDAVIVLNKPAGLAVQGGTGQARHLDGLLDCLCDGTGVRPRLVHRLDRDTTGLLVLARTGQAARTLARTFEGRRVRKVYWAVVRQTPPQEKGWIFLPLCKQSGPLGEKMVVDARAGRPSLSLYVRIAATRAGVCWVALMPLSGRTHQLRVHCAESGAAVLGDRKYGPGDNGGAMMLHARELSLPHPQDGTTLRVQAPAPAPMAQELDRLGFPLHRGEDAVAVLEQYATDLRHCPPRALDLFFRDEGIQK